MEINKYIYMLTVGNEENLRFMLIKYLHNQKEYMLILGEEGKLRTFKENNIQKMEIFSEGIWDIQENILIIEHKKGSLMKSRVIISILLDDKNISLYKEKYHIPLSEEEYLKINKELSQYRKTQRA